MNRTVLVIGIIFLLIGVSVVSSTGTIVEDAHIDYQPLESIIEFKEVLNRGNIAYGIGQYGLDEGLFYFGHVMIKYSHAKKSPVVYGK